MTDITADHGTILPAGATALVVTREGELSFLLPKDDDDQEVPRLVQLLAAVAARSADPEWIEEMLASIQPRDG